MPRTIALTKVAWSVLMIDRRLILLPVYGVMVAASFFGLMVLSLWSTDFFGRSDIDIGGLTVYRLITETHVGGIRPLDVVIVIAGYLTIAGALSFFNAVLFVAAKDLLEGRRRPLRFAFMQVARRLPELIGWICFATTIGIGIEFLRSSENLLLKIPGFIVGIFWGFATYFVVPILVVEGLTPYAALKRSTSVVRETWGVRLVQQFGFSLVFFFLALLLISPCLLAALGAPFAVVLMTSVVCLPTFLVGLVVFHALDQVFQVAIFMYASNGLIPSAFPPDMVKYAYRSKGEGTWANLFGGVPPSSHQNDTDRPKSIDDRIGAARDRNFL